MGTVGLIGSYEHAIDANGRLSIPAQFREYLTVHSGGIVIMTAIPVNDCAVAYPLPAWNEITERARQLQASGTPNIKGFLSLFYAGAVECPLDKHGRILLPAELRTKAGLDRETVLIGYMNSFEIWDTGRRRQKEAQLLDDAIGLQTAMEKLGV
jgi:MraZ protein